MEGKLWPYHSQSFMGGTKNETENHIFKNLPFNFHTRKYKYKVLNDIKVLWRSQYAIYVNILDLLIIVCLLRILSILSKLKFLAHWSGI